MAKIQEMIQAGWISRDKALSLLDFPDLEAYESLETANETLVNDVLTDILKTSKYQPPEPQMDLVMAAQTAHQYYLRGRSEGTSEESLELLLRFIDDAERLENQKQQQNQPLVAPPTPVAPGAPVDPLGTPEQLPVSDLLPQV